MSKQLKTINIITEKSGFFASLISYKIEDKDEAEKKFLELAAIAYPNSFILDDNLDEYEKPADIFLEELRFEDKNGDVISLVESTLLD